MLFIHLSAVFGVLLAVVCFWGAGRRGGSFRKSWLTALLFAALLVRLLAAALSKGFGSDTACFAAWADRIYELGPGGFYSPDVFTDYPPGYMYVLWLLGAVKNLLHLEYYSVPHLLLLKLPAIACDLSCTLLLFREAARKCSEHQAFFLCLAYLFNPAVLLNSSVWGQVDSVYTLAVVYMCLCLIYGRMYSTYIAFGISVLIKPQTLMFAPVLLAGIIDRVFLKDFSVKNFLHNLFQGLTAIAGMVILCLPFGLGNVWEQYFSTVTSYPYAAVNACNFWGFFGLNWVSQDTLFLGIPYRVFGWAAIFAAVAVTLLLSLRNRRDYEKYPFLGAFLMLTIYVFSVRMHERYLYPALILLLLAYVYKPFGRTWLCYAGFSLMHFYNTADVLFFYDPSSYDRKSPLILLVSAGMLTCAGLLFHVAWECYRGKGARTVSWSSSAPSPALSALAGLLGKETGEKLRTSRRGTPLKKGDFLCMAAITFAYGCFALYDLGDRQAPVTTYDCAQGDSITLDFGTDIPVTLSYYIAPWHDRTFALEGASSGEETWFDLGEVSLDNVFTWQEVPLTYGASRLRFTLRDTQASLIEFTFLDGDDRILTPVNAQDYPALFDEARLHPQVKTFRNSMYFDEIYHGRTAYEFLNGLTTYETTHPPLGKILIALGVALFGMNPFGWRIVGTLLGIAMVPLVYLFARRVSESTPLAALACVLFSFDFMHFAQTRLATIDVYITFFVILMYYFMYQYCQLSFYDTDLKKTFLPLGACGVCMGLGIASKWTGVYAGAGLAVIFFYTLYRRYREYLYAKASPSGTTKGISHRHIVNSFLPNARRTIYFCLVFFVAVPVIIYLLSYIPFRDYSDRGLVSRMLYNQQTMFSYHSGLDSTHSFSSSWYEWPVMKRPIWYYSRTVTYTAKSHVHQTLAQLYRHYPHEGTRLIKSNLREGISSFGNPAVWWAGIPASLYMLCLWAKKKDRTAAFLTIGYIAQYLPWFFVTRITFIYHYFPSVVFIVLMIMHSLRQWKDRLPKPAFLAGLALYGAAAAGLFLLFYPVLSGQPVEAAFVADYLRWFKSWVLTSM